MPHFTQSLKKELSFYGFEPVNLITGSVLYEGMDFSFPGALCREDAFKSQGIHGNDLQRRGHSFFGSIEQGRQEKVQVHSNPLRPDILLHSHSDRCSRHGGRSLCPRLGRYADGAFVKHRLQHAAQFCPCHIEGYETGGQERRKII